MLIGHQALVSVITIFLDEERFLAEAVESVIAQTYENWELLLVDDGSTDGSTEMARGFVERFPERIRYLEHEGHENRGASASRNLGIHYARGDYIALLDADDMWLSHKLRRQLEIMDSHPEVGMLCGASEYWAGWTGQPEGGVITFSRSACPQIRSSIRQAWLRLVIPWGLPPLPARATNVTEKRRDRRVRGVLSGFLRRPGISGEGVSQGTAVQISWAEQRRLLKTREKASPKGCSGAGCRFGQDRNHAAVPIRPPFPSVIIAAAARVRCPAAGGIQPGEQFAVHKQLLPQQSDQIGQCSAARRNIGPAGQGNRRTSGVITFSRSACPQIRSSIRQAWLRLVIPWGLPPLPARAI